MEQLEEKLKQARAARKSNLVASARNLYSLILQEDSSHSEASFFSAYYTITEGDSSELYDCYMKFADVIMFSIIGCSIASDKELLQDMAACVKRLPTLIFNKMNRIVCETHLGEDRARLESANLHSIGNLYFFGDMVEQFYASNEAIINEIAVDMWKEAIKLQRQWVGVPYDEGSPREYADKIKKYDPKYVLPKENFLRKFLARAILFLSRFGQ